MRGAIQVKRRFPRVIDIEPLQKAVRGQIMALSDHPDPVRLSSGDQRHPEFGNSGEVPLAINRMPSAIAHLKEFLYV